MDCIFIYIFFLSLTHTLTNVSLNIVKCVSMRLGVTLVMLKYVVVVVVVVVVC